MIAIIMAVVSPIAVVSLIAVDLLLTIGLINIVDLIHCGCLHLHLAKLVTTIIAIDTIFIIISCKCKRLVEWTDEGARWNSSRRQWQQTHSAF